MVSAGVTRSRRGRGLYRLVVSATILGIALLVSACGEAKVQSADSSQFAGTTVTPVKPAPPLHLPDYLGRKVNLAQFRGKAVIVTFLYTHCPDICPLITGNLHAAQEQLGSEAKQLQIIAVSVDPRGDTLPSVIRFLSQHQMTGKMKWLGGSVPELQRTWARWGVSVKSPGHHPDQVGHSGQSFGIDAKGRIRTVYPPNFDPEQIVADVPKLAAG